jgi:hypothetical protein
MKVMRGGWADLLVVKVTRTEIIRARVTKAEKKKIADFAKAAKVTESDVIRYALLEAKVTTK